MRLGHWIILVFFIVGLLMYFLGWLVVNDYSIYALGFIISVGGFLAILGAVVEDIRKRPLYWYALAKQYLPYFFAFGLVSFFLGYFLTSYVHLGFAILYLFGFNALIYSALGLLLCYIREYMKRRRKKKQANYQRF